MPSTGEWVMLAYRMRREPSSGRVTVWRKLRRLGALQIVDGLVTLPRDRRTQEQFEWLADAIIEAGGESSLWFSRPATAGQEGALRAQMSAAAAEDYRQLIGEVNQLLAINERIDRRTVARLTRELDRIRRRDYYPPPEKDRAVRAIERLAAVVAEDVGV